MKICFYGVGGVGGYFGSLITQKYNKEHDIYFIARGKHKDAINSCGLTLKKAGGSEIIKVKPKLCSENINDIPVCDIIVLSVKGYDLEGAAKDIKKIAYNDSIVLPLMNGVDINERIRKHLKISKVLPSCVYIGSYIEGPGIIFQNGTKGEILVGYDPKFPNFYPEALLTILKESGIDFSWERNIQIAIWPKFMFIAAFGMVTAAFNKTLGEILENPELSNLTKDIMLEIEEISKKLNIPLGSNIIESSFLKAKQFPYKTKTSLQRDIETKGKLNESDIFGGTIIRLGKKVDVNIPITQEINERLLSI